MHCAILQERWSPWAIDPRVHRQLERNARRLDTESASKVLAKLNIVFLVVDLESRVGPRASRFNWPPSRLVAGGEDEI